MTKRTEKPAKTDKRTSWMWKEIIAKWRRTEERNSEGSPSPIPEGVVRVEFTHPQEVGSVTVYHRDGDSRKLEDRISGIVRMKTGVEIDVDATVEGSVRLDSYVFIGKGCAILGNSNKGGSTCIGYGTRIDDHTWVSSGVVIGRDVNIGGHVHVSYGVRVGNNAFINNRCILDPECAIGPRVEVPLCALVPQNMVLMETDRYLRIGPLGSREDDLWVILRRGGKIQVHTGCFGGTKEQFLKAIEARYGEGVAHQSMSDFYRESYKETITYAENVLRAKRRAG